jgi:hypothetical protein
MMDSHDLKLIPIGPPIQLRQLTIPPLVEEAQTILHRHGCTFTEHSEARIIIRFPEGTTRTEEMLRTHSEHYRIELPDGYILYESFDRQRELSFLEYLPE